MNGMSKEEIINLLERRRVFLVGKLVKRKETQRETAETTARLEEIEYLLNVIKGV